MNKTIIAALLLSSVQGFAQFGSGGTTATTRGTVQVQPTPAASSGSAALPTSMSTATTGVNDSSTQAQSGNANASRNASMISSGLTTAGTAIVAACSTSGCQRPGWVMIGLGVLAGIQANNHSGTSGGAGFTGDSTYGGDRNGDYSNGNTITGRQPFNEDSFASNFNRDMGNKGINASYDPKTKALKLPGGGSLKLSDIGNQSAMAAAGFSKSDIDSAFAQLKDLEKKANAKFKVGEIGTEDNAGGGGGSKSGDSSGVAGDAAGAGANRDLASLNTKNAAQGLTKDYHGEPIGVANDSLFDMMARRYQLKSRQDSFFNGTELVLQK